MAKASCPSRESKEMMWSSALWSTARTRTLQAAAVPTQQGQDGVFIGQKHCRVLRWNVDQDSQQYFRLVVLHSRRWADGRSRNISNLSQVSVPTLAARLFKMAARKPACS